VLDGGFATDDNDGMVKHPLRLVVVVIAVGWLFDFLFWRQRIGLNFALFIGLAILLGLLWLVGEGRRPAWQSIALLAPVGLLSVFMVIRREPLTMALSALFVGISTFLMAISYSGGGWPGYGLVRYFSRHLLLLGTLIAEPLRFISWQSSDPAQAARWRKLLPSGPVFRGVLLAVPIVVIFTGLLTSADLIFNQLVYEFFADWSLARVFEYLFRLLLILGLALAALGLLRHADAHSQDDVDEADRAPLLKPFLGLTETGIVLSVVLLLFVIFVSVQFQYFFYGRINIGAEGFTFSQYARRGFNELLIVGFTSLLLVMAAGSVTRRENALQRRVFSLLSAGIVAAVIPILISAYHRLTLAIAWHGYSRLRLYPRAFLVWVAILFITIVLLEVFRRERYFAFSFYLASLGFVLTLGIWNVDAAIVQQNVLRATQGRHFNAHHLASLSTDVVPPMVEAYRNAPLSDEHRDALGAQLVCMQHFRAEWVGADWRSFSLSHTQARAALDDIMPELEHFKVNDQRWPIRIRAAGDLIYECPARLRW
jgi:hypothetical protein